MQYAYRLSRVLVRRRINAQPPYQHRAPIVADAVMCLPSLMRQVAVAVFRIALLIVFDFIQRYSPPLTGVIAGENKGVNPHGFRAVYPFGFMCCCDQLAVVFICCFLQVLHMRLLSKIHLLLLYICANWVIGKQTTKPHEFLRLGNWYLYQIVLFLVWTEYHHLA